MFVGLQLPWNLSRADCDAPCFDQLKRTHLRLSPKQLALLDVFASADQNMAAHNRSLIFITYMVHKEICHTLGV